jgi:hypothetical protein
MDWFCGGPKGWAPPASSGHHRLQGDHREGATRGRGPRLGDKTLKKALGDKKGAGSRERLRPEAKINPGGVWARF